MDHSSIVVVANRLPVDEVVKPDGSREWCRSPGGLVTALTPILRETRATWVGWAGNIGDAPQIPQVDGIRMHALPMSETDFADYYEGYSNSTLWPLYHDAVEPAAHHRHWWESYERMNRRFASAAAMIAEPGATVWVHDYQLQLVPRMLREMRPDLRIGFFFHIPFPPPELFLQLSRRVELLQGVLGADLVGFQNPHGAQNFIRLASRLLNTSTTMSTVEVGRRSVTVGAFPISVDVAEMEQLVGSDSVQARAAQIRADLGDPKFVLLGVDRLDYTKGIDHRLKAYRELLADGRIRVPETVMIQVAVPSRERVEHYQMLRERIQSEVGRINGQFGTLGVPAIHYLNKGFGRDELAAMYLAADAMLVTPLRDGMNLVAKEYCAARVDLGGTLILSEFAGAAAELRDAYLINPHDVEGLKDTLVSVMEGNPLAHRRRMLAMRRQIRANDVRAWARRYLEALAAAAPSRQLSQPAEAG